ncbi:helix-turn-helix domain-containing protein [Virgibacillus massiliensis]|nr:helix-turn-helix domain-containing protein [Virgibacillus massiliensis]
MIILIKLLIDERIKQSGLKKKFIANEMGVNKDTLTNWCKNRSMISLNQAVKLADILNCKVENLYERE